MLAIENANLKSTLRSLNCHEPTKYLPRFSRDDRLERRRLPCGPRGRRQRQADARRVHDSPHAVHRDRCGRLGRPDSKKRCSWIAPAAPASCGLRARAASPRSRKTSGFAGWKCSRRRSRDEGPRLSSGVQGKDISEMLEFARRAEDLAADAVIAMPPTTGQTMEDYGRYFRALADVARRPVIVQTSGGNRALAPSTELIVQLAREFPTFGYVKEENRSHRGSVCETSSGTVRRCGNFRSELCRRLAVRAPAAGSTASSPATRCSADLMARIWDLHEHAKTDEVRDAYSKFLLMRNLEEQIPGSSLHVMKMQGIFKTTTIRVEPPVPGTPQKVRQATLPDDAIAEIEYRLAALKPHPSFRRPRRSDHLRAGRAGGADGREGHEDISVLPFLPLPPLPPVIPVIMRRSVLGLLIVLGPFVALGVLYLLTTSPPDTSRVPRDSANGPGSPSPSPATC